MSFISTLTRIGELESSPISSAIQQDIHACERRVLAKTATSMLRLTAFVCCACQFDQAHRRPWHVKGKKSRSTRKPEHKEPGDGVSVDQIISAQPGLIPQMSGFLTNKQIWGCTTFVDHVSNFVYIHLMRDFTLSETLFAKTAWEKLLAQAGHMVKHYHANNGQFADNGFLSAVNSKDQKAHFVALEHIIKMTLLKARTRFFHKEQGHSCCAA